MSGRIWFPFVTGGVNARGGGSLRGLSSARPIPTANFSSIPSYPLRGSFGALRQDKAHQHRYNPVAFNTSTSYNPYWN